MPRGIVKNTNFNPIELELLPSHSNHDRSDDEDQNHITPISFNFVKRITHALKTTRSFLFLRLFSALKEKKKRYLSVFAAAVIAAGLFPSQVTAESSLHHTRLTKVVTTSIRTTMDSEIQKSMRKNSFLQYHTKAPNNYFEDVTVDPFFDTEIQRPSELDSSETTNTNTNDIDDHDFEPENTVDGRASDLPSIEDATQTITADQYQSLEGDVMVLNDKMIKNGMMNFAKASGGAAALYFLSRKAFRSNSQGNGAHENRISETVDFNTNNTANHGVDSGPAIVLARQQPKSPMEEAILAAKYAAISSVEERAFQILVDLGMV